MNQRINICCGRRRGFSLVELLLAVFILAIGIIGISALFPAGIAQQRQATDDIMGPVVADNAMAILRTKLKPEWFGSCDEFFQPSDRAYPNGFAPAGLGNTIPGDWRWKRPGFLFANNTNTAINELGAIDIFSALYTSNMLGGALGSALNPSLAATEDSDGGDPVAAPLFGIPFNRAMFDPQYQPWPSVTVRADTAPLVIVTQQERSYPMSGSAGSGTKRPQYFWECMFRKFEGRVQVAVFVFRVSDSGGEPRAYTVAQSLAAQGALVPPLPMVANLSTTPWRVGGLDGIAVTISDNSTLLSVAPAATPASLQVEQSWQSPGQWIIDEFNSVHRVLMGRRTTKDSLVTLTRPLPDQPGIPAFFGNANTGAVGANPGVRAPAFIPTTDARNFTLVPIYATVQEL